MNQSWKQVIWHLHDKKIDCCSIDIETYLCVYVCVCMYVYVYVHLHVGSLCK